MLHQEVVGVLDLVGPLHPVAIPEAEHPGQIKSEVISWAVVVGADNDAVALAQAVHQRLVHIGVALGGQGVVAAGVGCATDHAQHRMHRHPGLDQSTGVHFPLYDIDFVQRPCHDGGLIEELLLPVGLLLVGLFVQGSGLEVDRLAVGIKVMEDDGGQLAITKLDDLAASVQLS